MEEATTSYDFQSELSGIISLLWGPPPIKDDVFRRWSQAFTFLPREPTALIQLEGGPCAVIAPVQAFMLKVLIEDRPEVGDWRSDEPSHIGQRSTCPNEMLVAAVIEILTQATAGGNYKIVYVIDPDFDGGDDEESVEVPAQAGGFRIPASDHRTFHAHLRMMPFEDVQSLRAYYISNYNTLVSKFGVLLVLYSIIATKGLAVISEEVNDASEPLIESTYGYGSQSLINLMLTGRAVAHVWDNDKDVGGLQLKGIDSQSEVGFLALLEHLRYCEVGSYLKNPRRPIWVLASETHLTVLFTPDERLVSPETVPAIAERVFRSFDPEGNNFIAATHLQEVLRKLDLVADPEYVQIMIKKLDAENLGIILLHTFLEEFFPEKLPTYPDTFTVFHYNGLPNSNILSQVVYEEGAAVILEADVRSVLASNPMLTCLQTKWPNIDITWNSGVTPSLN